MKLGHIARSSAAGAIIYVAMAACASSDHGQTAGADGGSLTTSPVPNASAAPSPASVDVATEECSKPMTLSGQAWVYAEHAYAGASLEDLAASVTAVAAGSGPPGYDRSTTFLYPKAGAVAVPCGPAGGQVTSVTFVRRL